MKNFSENEFTIIEEKISSVGMDLSIITSLIKFLDLALNDDLGVSDMDLANISSLLKQRIFDVNSKYDEIECLLCV